eukprot:TRINITY_DN2937_c0_g2_i9.p1 TRINITY_DN2937_c0_g2~~TRINITY_DN2937_c0_g2_i9.p1  ORF type:complete len:794 (+),score=204.80 TRINITY_DN2937_c0_g2_i9:778-3159(+)
MGCGASSEKKEDRSAGEPVDAKPADTAPKDGRQAVVLHIQNHWDYALPPAVATVKYGTPETVEVPAVPAKGAYQISLRCDARFAVKMDTKGDRSSATEAAPRPLELEVDTRTGEVEITDDDPKDDFSWVGGLQDALMNDGAIDVFLSPFRATDAVDVSDIPDGHQVVEEKYYPAGYFPEREDGAFWDRTTDAAVCLSGGGTRAYSCSVGVFRALERAKAMHKVRYVCGNSGGNWAMAAYLYSPRVRVGADGVSADEEDVAKMLGATTFVPRGITMESVTETSAMLEAVRPERGYLGKLVAAAASLGYQGYPKLVCDRFLEKCAGVKTNNTPAWSEAQIDDVVQRNPHAKREWFTPQRPNTPYALSTLAVYGPTQFIPFNKEKLHDFTAVHEAGPLGVGNPSPPQEITICCAGDLGRLITSAVRKAAFALQKLPFMPTLLTETEPEATVDEGGGLWEPFGMGGVPVDNGLLDTSKPGQCKVARSRRFTFKECVGYSSTAYAGTVGVITRLLTGLMPRYPVVPVVPTVKQSKYVGQDWMVTDGAYRENFGLYSALRRQVTNVVWCNWTDVAPPHTRNDTSARHWYTKEEFDAWPKGKRLDGYGGGALFAGFFDGFEEDTVEPAMFIVRNNVVFPRETLWGIIDALQTAAKEDRPCVYHCDGVRVLDNKYHGIRSTRPDDSPYEVNLTVVVLQWDNVPRQGRDEEKRRNAGFNALCSDEVLNAMSSDSDHIFNDFPNCKTMFNSSVTWLPGLSVPKGLMGLDVETANLLAAFTDWTLTEWMKTDDGQRVAKRLVGV